MLLHTQHSTWYAHFHLRCRHNQYISIFTSRCSGVYLVHAHAYMYIYMYILCMHVQYMCMYMCMYISTYMYIHVQCMFVTCLCVDFVPSTFISTCRCTCTCTCIHWTLTPRSSYCEKWGGPWGGEEKPVDGVGNQRPYQEPQSWALEHDPPNSSLPQWQQPAGTLKCIRIENAPESKWCGLKYAILLYTIMHNVRNMDIYLSLFAPPPFEAL